MIDTILELKNKCTFVEEIGRIHNLTPGEVSCIWMIASHGGASLKEIAEAMSLSISRGSRVVNSLRERGLLTVVPNRNDRRAVKLSLTGAGQQCFTDLQNEKDACDRRLSEGLTPEEQNKIREGLSLLLRVM